MKKQIAFISFILPALFQMISCVALPEFDQAPKSVEVPAMQKISMTDLPPDVKLIVAAFLFKVRGYKPETDKVVFNPAGKHNVSENNFKYKGFSVTAITITGHESILIGENYTKTTLEGLILLKDAFDRSAGLYFATQYTTTKQGISIETSRISPMPPDFPRVEAYLVPKSKLDATPKNSLNDYPALYTFALENAVPMTLKKGEKKKNKEDEYLILIFCKDRLLDDSALVMKVTQLSSMWGKSLIEPIYLNDLGFRFMIGAGKFHTNKSEHAFNISVEYTLNPADNNARSVIVGDFSSQAVRL